MNPALDAFTRPVCLDVPRRLTPLSAWHEHIPFAMNVVAALKPRMLVELGTHAGDSYCAMCQAVQAGQLPTRCFAIDTWQGDDQAGRYGPEVLGDLRAHHDELYGTFSVLLQSTFANALGQFEEGSIDLLHIDGLHTYEAVRADFEGWLPKLSAAGVVLLHDISVREGTFGVWKVWDEVKPRFPHFEFVHGHGLGIVAVGSSPPEALAPLLGANEEDTAAIRQFFHYLGQHVAALELARRDREAVTVLRAAIADTAARLELKEADLQRAGIRLAEERAAAETRAAAARADQAALEQQLRDASVRQRNTAEQLEVLQAKLRAIEGSRGYRTLMKLYQARDALTPARISRRG